MIKKNQKLMNGMIKIFLRYKQITKIICKYMLQKLNISTNKIILVQIQPTPFYKLFISTI